MGIKFSQFGSAGTPTQNDVVVGLQDGTNRKFSLSSLLAWIKGQISPAGILKGDGQGGISAAVAGTDYQGPLTFDAAPTPGSTNPVTSEGIDTAIKARYTSTTLYTTLTDVKSDTTITMGDDFTDFKWLMIIFNSRSPASANYRMPLVISTNAIPQGGFYPLINPEANGYVRVNYISGQTKQLRIQATNFSALYIAGIYGLT